MDVVQDLNPWLAAVWHESGPLLTSGAIVAFGAAMHLLVGLLLRRLQAAARRSANRWDDVVLASLVTPLRVVIWVLVAYLLLSVNAIAPDWRGVASQVYDTALVLLLAWFLHRLVRESETELLAARTGTHGSSDKATVHAVAKLLRITLWVIAGLMTLQSIGISISGLLAFGGIGGIAVGFAAKDLLANFFGAMSIYLDRPFSPGDWIRSPDREIEGTVEDIGWRLTRIRTFDQRPLYVPNAVFSQIAVENPSRMLNRRIYETIGIRYRDASLMAAIVGDVREMLQHHEAIDTGRTLIVNFVSFGPSSLDFFVYAFTRTTNWVEYHRIKQEILLQVLGIVRRHGADVAYPTRTLHLEQVAPEPRGPQSAGDRETA